MSADSMTWRVRATAQTSVISYAVADEGLAGGTSTAQPAMSSHLARPSRELTCRRLSLRSASRRRSVSCASRSSDAFRRLSSASRSLASGEGRALVGAVDGRRREPEVALRMPPPLLRLCGGESEPNAGVDDGVGTDQLEPDAADETLARESCETSGGGVNRVELCDAPPPEAVELAPGERGPNVPAELVADRVWSSSDSPPTRLASGSIDGLRFLAAAEAAATTSLAGDTVGVTSVLPRMRAGEGGMPDDVPLSVDRVDRFVVVRSRLSSRSDLTALMLVWAPTVRFETRRERTSSPWASRSIR